jgi:hypothetical protein
MMTITTSSQPVAPAETVSLQALVNVIIQRLSLPRPLSLQVSTALADNYTVSEAEYEAFFANKLATLDDYEVDLVFSPQFTPKTDDLDVVFDCLGVQILTPVEMDTLIQQIVTAGVGMPLVLPSGSTVVLPLHEVMIQRFVRLLFVAEVVPEPFTQALTTVATVETTIYNRLLYLVRQPIYRRGHYAPLFATLLTGFAEKTALTLEKVVFLHEFIQTYKPAALTDLVRQINALIASCEADMVTAVERSYHNDEIKFGSSGSDDDYAEAEVVRDSYRDTIRLCNLVKEDLAVVLR